MVNLLERYVLFQNIYIWSLKEILVGLPRGYLHVEKAIRYLCKEAGYLALGHNRTWLVQNTVKEEEKITTKSHELFMSAMHWKYFFSVSVTYVV